jgi:CheY-like chemotaxis protein
LGHDAWEKKNSPILSDAREAAAFFSVILKTDPQSNGRLIERNYLTHPEPSDTKMTMILVVDDSRVSRLLSRQFILQKHPDWAVAEAASGEEALDKLQSITPDLIMLDLNMPGMGGFAAVEKIRQQYPASRITLLTANVQDATRDRAAALGISFAEKPITETRIDQIVAVLESP